MSIRFRFVFLDRDKHFLVVDTDLVRGTVHRRRPVRTDTADIAKNAGELV